MEVVAKGKNTNRKLSPDTGKVSTDRLTKGARVSRHKRMEIRVSRNEKRFLRNSIKYLPVILERREKVVGNRVVKKYGVE